MSQRLLYQFETSPFCAKVKAVLAYKGLDYDTLTISPLSKKEIKFSKHGKVPILSDGDTIIEDSTDIVLYLEDTYPTPPLIPKKAKDKDEVLKWEEWADTYMPHVYQYIAYTRPTNSKRQMRLEALGNEGGDTWERFVIGTAGPFLFPLMLKTKMKLGSLHDLKDEVHLTLDRLENQLDGKTFLLGDKLTLADVVIHGFVNNFRGLKGDDLFFSRPTLAAWDRRVAEAIPNAPTPVNA